MTISERLFQIMKKKNVSMPELSRMTGISRHTIYDWQKKNTNPGSDKIMVICEALEITPEELLVGSTDCSRSYYDLTASSGEIETQIMKGCQNLSDTQKKDCWHI